ncbi:hypothetical protein [uncultured Desulfovibrio sp.]|uniref:hypothetical protein n=1 Tax=uncultured Desulfovibrio sp. TaxID=167968 RepID=UPI0026038D1D|nr:hypothetical protein [uncultured Desulfovibrio sp.]
MELGAKGDIHNCEKIRPLCKEVFVDPAGGFQCLLRYPPGMDFRQDGRFFFFPPIPEKAAQQEKSHAFSIAPFAQLSLSSAGALFQKKQQNPESIAWGFPVRLWGGAGTCGFAISP